MSEELNKEDLNKAIASLPETDPEPGLWNRIEERLDFEEKVEPVIKKLPEYEPIPELWDAVENDMARERLRIKSRDVLRFSIAIAASLLIGIFGWLYFFKSSVLTEKVEYSQELLVPEDTTGNSEHFQQMAMNYIRESCVEQPAKCSLEDISSLKQELQYLDKQGQLLKEAVSKYGTDDNFIKAQIKVENMKSQVIKELIQKLNS